MENWKDIIGFEGLYQISDMGRVRSIRKNIIMKPTLNTKKYFRLNLCKNKVEKSYLVHRLVATHFLDNPKNKPQVNHINGIKTDNRLINLEWNTGSENMEHAVKMELVVRGSKVHTSKLSEKQVLEIRNSNLPNYDLSLIYDVHRSTICDIKNRVSWKHLN